MPTYAKLTPTRHLDLFLVTRIFEDPQTLTKAQYVDMTAENPQPQVGWFYHVTDGFSETVPSASVKGNRMLAPYEFYFGRLTDDERGKMYALAVADGGGVTLNQVQRGRLSAFLQLTATNDVGLDHKETVFIINALETAGAFDAGRAAEILE